jgi:hypothetical protein
VVVGTQLVHRHGVEARDGGCGCWGHAVVLLRARLGRVSTNPRLVPSIHSEHGVSRVD